MWQHQGHDLAECQREGPFFATTFFRPFKDQAGEWRNGTSFGLNDLEALMNVAEMLHREASGPPGASFHAQRCKIVLKGDTNNLSS